MTQLKRALLLALALLLLTSRPALAASIALDGQFGDWAGEPNITDPAGDASPPRTDVITLYWATNPGDPTAYFMVQRDFPGGQGAQKVYYRIFVDTACNGSYDEPSDRVIWVEYDPSQSAGTTTLSVSRGDGAAVSSTSGDWGDPANGAPTGGTRTEFGVAFDDLGITVNQTICFYLGVYASAKDTSPADTMAAVQWAPVPALGYPLLLVVAAGVTVLAWRRGRWLRK